MSYIIVENENLYLKRTILDEIDFVQNAEAENECFILPYSRDRIIEALVSTEEVHCVLVEKTTKQRVGFLLFHGLDNPHQSLELRRIVITEKSKSYGLQALALATKYCFEVLGYHRLWLDVFTDNPIAIALYEKAGFEREGLLRDSKLKNGVWRSQYIYSKIVQF